MQIRKRWENDSCQTRENGFCQVTRGKHRKNLTDLHKLANIVILWQNHLTNQVCDDLVFKRLLLLECKIKGYISSDNLP